MCEYITHLDKFKKYKYPCKRKTKEILNSENALSLLNDCLNLNTSNNYNVYIFYKTNEIIYHSTILYFEKEKNDNKNFKKFQSSIIQGSKGSFEIYVFEKEDYNAKEKFKKLFDLINEFCDVDKIENDYKDNFITKFKHIAEDFLLDTYTLINTKNLRFFSIFLFTFMVFEYAILINSGYPFSLIDKFSMLFLSQYLFIILGITLLLSIVFATFTAAYLSKLGLSKSKGNKVFKKTISSMLYVFLIIIIIIKVQYSEKINHLFLNAYNSIHIYPRLAIKNNLYKLIIGDDSKRIYTYNLGQLIDKNLTNIICKDTNNSLNSNNILTTIMLKSTHIDIKKIILEKSNKNLQLIDHNISKKIIMDKFCHP